MSKHTKGPWFRDKYGAMVDAKGESILLRGVSTLCSGSDDRMEMAEANTTLACAAPELLEALHNALASCLAWQGEPDDFSCSIHRAVVEQCRAAIRKALGEE